MTFDFSIGLKWVTAVLPYLACYGTAAFIGCSIALIELLSRYGSGNNPRWIIFGRPQTVYYLINSLAAILTLFVADATGATSVISKFSENSAIALVKAAQIGIVSMFALRSSLYSIERSDKKVKFDLGPAQIINVLNRYLDRQMDQNRGRAAIKEVSEIMKDFKHNLLDLGALCLAVPEAIPPEDMVRMRKNIEAIVKSKETSPEVKPILAGIELQKEVGADNLRSAVEVLKSNVAIMESNTVGKPGLEAGAKPVGSGRPDATEAVRTGEPMVSSEEQVDEELSSFYNELSAGTAPAAGKDGGER